MMKRPLFLNPAVAGACIVLSLFANASAAVVAEPASRDKGAPQLRRQGTATQLVVDGQPFLVIGGELRNSSSSSREFMKPIWDQLVALNLNTVLAAVSWELTEPVEGKFDFTVVDELVEDARAHQMKLVLLWFGAWKNGLSSYAPVWVKRDPQRFPRVQLANGGFPELLSPLALGTAEVEARAFSALMKHVREIDRRDHTVVMVQVENEVGVLNDSRDRSAAAEKVFAGPVPAELLKLFSEHKATLAPELLQVWETNGAKTSGSWAEVFGPTKPKDFVLTWDLPEPLRQTEWRKFHWPVDEIFMAWHYARYVNVVTEAGKRAYDIPMFVNAWLQQPGCAYPGTYPSGGPVFQVADVWRAGAPAIDLLSPDLYVTEFDELCGKYVRNGNSLFIPETSSGPRAPFNLFLAVGKYNAIGFSPFGIDRQAPVAPRPMAPAPDRFNPPDTTLEQSYEIMRQIAPLVLQHQGLGSVIGFSLDKDNPSIVTKLGEAEIEISLDLAFGRRAEKGFGLVVAVGPDEFYGAGSGFCVTFRPVGPTRRGVGAVNEGVFRNGKWIPGRRLNGDETDQGRSWRFAPGGVAIEHCTAYRIQ